MPWLVENDKGDKWRAIYGWVSHKANALDFMSEDMAKAYIKEQDLKNAVAVNFSAVQPLGHGSQRFADMESEDWTPWGRPRK